MTEEELEQGPLKCIERLQAEQEAENFGIFKIIPPHQLRGPSLSSRFPEHKAFEVKLQAPQMMGAANQGVWGGPDMNLSSYSETAKEVRELVVKHLGVCEPTERDFETQFLKLIQGAPLSPEEPDFQCLYASDLPLDQYMGEESPGDSPTSSYQDSAWNVSRFPAADGSLLSCVTARVSGITSPFLYLGATYSW